MNRPPVCAVGVIGAGTMGVGIAHVFAQASCTVALAEPDQQRPAAAVRTITAYGSPNLMGPSKLPSIARPSAMRSTRR
jgi:3-hydroxyacyl-CoA dehydrogenase